MMSKIITVLLLTLYCVPIFAQSELPATPEVSGEWDTRFSPPQMIVDVSQAEFWQGNWYFLGSFYPRTESLLIWNEVAKSWQTVGQVGNARISRMQIFDDGLYVMGSFQDLAGIPEADYIARWDGQKWHAVIPNLKLTPRFSTEPASVNQLHLYKGKWYVRGNFWDADNQPNADYVFVYDGQKIHPLSDLATLNNRVTSIAVYRDELIIVGVFTDFVNNEHDYLARFDGTTWKSLQMPWNNSYPTDIIVYQDKLFVSGNIFSEKKGLATWDGTTWSLMDFNPFQIAGRMQVFDNKLFVDGNTDGLGITQGVQSVAKLENGKWSSMFSDPTCTQGLMTSQTKLFTEGCYLNQNGQKKEGVAFLSGAYSSTIEYTTALLGMGLSSQNGNGRGWEWKLPTVNDIVVYKNEVHIGGDFSHAPYNASVNGLIKWNKTSWEYFSPQPQDWKPLGFKLFKNEIWTTTIWGPVSWNEQTWSWQEKVPQSEVHPFAFYASVIEGDDVYFASGQIPCGRIACFICRNNIWKWDGKNITTLYANSTTECASYEALHKNKDSDELIAIMRKSTPPQTYISGLFAWNNGTFRLLSPDIQFNIETSAYRINKMISYKGELYIIGNFAIKNLPEANHIARWDGQKFHALGKGLDGEVLTLLFHETGIYAGGTFLKTGDGTQVNGLARFDGTSWRPVGGGVSHPFWTNENNGVPHVRALAAIGNDIFVGGKFGTTGNVAANSFNIYHIKSVTSNPPTETPSFVASHVFPNPATQTASLNLQLKSTENVKIRVFDLLGRQHLLLHEGILKNAMLHSFMIDVQQLPSGVYLCQIEGESFKETKRLVVMK